MSKKGIKEGLPRWKTMTRVPDNAPISSCGPNFGREKAVSRFRRYQIHRNIRDGM
jgi:hypothetical protein